MGKKRRKAKKWRKHELDALKLAKEGLAREITAAKKESMTSPLYRGKAFDEW